MINYKKKTLKHVAEGAYQAILASKGKAKTKDAKAFLNEL